MSEVDPSLNEIITLTRTWFEEELKTNFNITKLRYERLEKYPLISQREYRCRPSSGLDVVSPFDDVNIVFLAGGTFRIPLLQKQIKEIFPNAEVVIDRELEIITATGAAIHALQVLNGEVEPYVKIMENIDSESGDNSDISAESSTEDEQRSDSPSEFNNLEENQNNCEIVLESSDRETIPKRKLLLP